MVNNLSNKGKNQKYQAIGTAPKYNRKIVEICKIDTPSTQIHDNSFKFQAWCMHFSIRDYGKLALWARTFLLSEMMRS